MPVLLTYYFKSLYSALDHHHACTSWLAPQYYSNCLILVVEVLESASAVLTYTIFISDVNRLGLGRNMLTDPYHSCMEADIG